MDETNPTAPLDTFEVRLVGAIFRAREREDELERDGWTRGDAEPDPRYGSVWFERRSS